ncbi:ribosomal-protein-alanine N-acetyltransferase [Longispora fulva]|uniref:Ribosomal protein S18 acetylase RimI-like enzyme n=1 Tax=Longispora fulva TaxID=619741 RepID=A0A8J7GZZ1_9ACTN|nr:GNAT family N-acetyltransferase [Longispora fulva]MBG6141571.1 ribosomal protein S18 acetylase RimI-like enzyme [Longispora fulva]GIG59276.1 ribosomal-protein-alanine N-acetyltransferase [Longispora fulva]
MEKDIVEIARIVEGLRWHALEDDEVVGRGDALRRPDGRVFLGIDAWRDEVFGLLAATMLSDLPGTVYTLVDEDDQEARARWRGAGFVVCRQERVYRVPTDPEITGLGRVPAPPGVTILPMGQAEEEPLRELDRVVRAEVDATVGWQSMPAEMRTRPDGTLGVIDPSAYVVAVQDGEYIGQTRVAVLPRRSRLGLVAVRTAHRRRGLARAMLAEMLGSLHRSGITSVSAEVDDLNKAAITLFESIGAQRVGGAMEMLHL